MDNISWHPFCPYIDILVILYQPLSWLLEEEMAMHSSIRADCSGQGLSLHLTQECMSFIHAPEPMATRGWVGASQSQAAVQQTLLHASRVQPP